jgi:hypothetical protein
VNIFRISSFLKKTQMRKFKLWNKNSLSKQMLVKLRRVEEVLIKMVWMYLEIWKMLLKLYNRILIIRDRLITDLFILILYQIHLINYKYTSKIIDRINK